MPKPATFSRLRKLPAKVSLPIMVALGFSLLQVTLPAFKPVSSIDGFKVVQKKEKSPMLSQKSFEEVARLTAFSDKPKQQQFKSETLTVALKTYKVPPSLANKAIEVLNQRGARNKSTTIYASMAGELKRLECQLKDRSRLIIFKSGKSYQLYHEPSKHYTFIQTISGTFQSNFYDSALALGVSPEVVFEVTHVLQDMVDFRKDIRTGDSFSLLIERSGIDNERLLGVRLRLSTKTIEIYAFVPQDGEGAYFTKDGKSFTTGFLARPVFSSRITSRFSMRRLHPVLGYVRPHYGVDYAAPYGTKVVAIGPGRVAYVGYKGGFGRLVEIYHPEFGFTSQYGHLSRYAASAKVGAIVSAGETIGYVGTSGITTGPHVHFGIKKNGSYLNPERISFPRFATLNATDRARFKRYVSKLRPLFEEQEMGVVMVSLPEVAG